MMGTGYHGGFGKTTGAEELDLKRFDNLGGFPIFELINHTNPSTETDGFFVELIADYNGYNKGLVGIVLSKDSNDTYKVKFFTRENKVLVIISVPILLLHHISHSEFKKYFE